MPAQFAVLASGSGGNAALLRHDVRGVLLDFGLGPRLLGERLAAAGATWRHVAACLLTHTHSDHWKDRTLAHLRQHKIPLYCHAGHVPVLRQFGQAYAPLEAAGLVRVYEPGRAFAPAPGLTARAVEVPHDSGPTFAFRLEGAPGLFGPAWSLGLVTDLGVWSEELADALAGVDVLAVEFNHDVSLEKNCGRPAELVRRVLGDEGHLSNTQAADLVAAVLARPGGDALRHVVQLHLSRDCNRPELAVAAARAALGPLRDAVAVHTARQDYVGPLLTFGDPGRRPAPARSAARRSAPTPRPLLPGLDA